MAGAATIVFAREDFTIPGTAEPAIVGRLEPAAAEARFFDLLRTSNPDVVVLDLSRANGSGIDAILKIRRKVPTPILVVCNTDDPSAREYRIAGAAECIPAPVDILLLNETLQRIIRVTGPGLGQRPHGSEIFCFCGISFHPHENLLQGAEGFSIRLTTSESRVLACLVAQPWVAHSRAEVGEMLYGRHRPISDRAIDVVINRLRKKLMPIPGLAGQNLIKTEFRRGYMFIADVSRAAAPAVTAHG